MKNNNKIYLLIALIVSTQLIFAEHKDAVYIVNHYGEEVFVNLKWRVKPSVSTLSSLVSFDTYEEIPIYEDQTYNDALEGKEFNERYEYKAPLSKYYLQEIVVTSAVSKAEKYYEQMSATISNDPYSTTHRYNTNQNSNEVRFQYIKPVSNNTFFVIEVDEQKSMATGQKQIKLTRFPSREAYRKELAKTNPRLLVHKEKRIEVSRPVQQPEKIFTQRPILQDEYSELSKQQYQNELLQVRNYFPQKSYQQYESQAMPTTYKYNDDDGGIVLNGFFR